ncbi:MAG: PAS domain-containing protein [Paracoccaceae bacterium]
MQLDTASSSNRLQPIPASRGVCFFVYSERREGWRHFERSGEALRDIFGISPDAAAASAELCWDRVRAEDRTALEKALRISAERCEPFAQRFRVLNPHRGSRSVLALAEPLAGADGSTRWHGVFYDLSDVLAEDRDRERMLRDLVAVNERYRIAQDAVGFGIWDLNLETGATFWDDRSREMFGVPDDGSGRAPTCASRASDPVEADRVRQALAVTMEGGGIYDETFRVRGDAGEPTWIRGVGKRVRGADGDRLVGINLDVTESRRIETELRRARDELADAQQIASVGSQEFCLVRGTARWSDEAFRILGHAPGSIVPSLEAMREAVRRDDRPVFDALIARTAEAPTLGEPLSAELRIRRPDGEERTVEQRFRVVRRNSTGGVCLGGTTHDITERRTAEDRARQSQKLEAVGQLTAGVAHDFNNLLAVILGNLELAREGAADAAEADELLSDALRAARRGAEMTKQLLSFSRRSSLRPQRLDLNRVLGELDALFRRTLAPMIEIECRRGASLWPVEVDPTQLETALLNLVLNARDAMPAGGRLTLETWNETRPAAGGAGPDAAPGGDCVICAIRDAGVGMAPEVVRRAVEPFFSTKAVGAGSGLGLSMVYGFLRQSGGTLEIDSAPGRGTTVRLVFPTAGGTSVHDTVEPDREIAPMVGRTRARILVVEDTDAVRRVFVAQLKRLGYLPVEAANGEDALAALRSNPEISVMLSDALMPGRLHGPALVAAAREVRPGLRVIVASGFPDIRADPAPDPRRGAGPAARLPHPAPPDQADAHLLKPVETDVLARTIETVLADD